ETDDGLSPPDPRFGVPIALAVAAYQRCIQILSTAYDGILRDPLQARQRMVGMQALIHAVQDSFSAAHADREAEGRGPIVHLLSWTLIDWPTYWRLGRRHFPPAIHHAASDKRDTEYLLPDARTPDGRDCREIFNPYAVPESCLSARGLAATDAVFDLFVLT